MDSARFVHIAKISVVMCKFITFRDIPLTSNTPKMSSNATVSAERMRTATGGLGSRHWTCVCCMPTALTHLPILTHRTLCHALNASVANNCKLYWNYYLKDGCLSQRRAKRAFGGR